MKEGLAKQDIGFGCINYLLLLWQYFTNNIVYGIIL
jgi:hypothetical protein